MANKESEYLIIEKKCGSLEFISDFIQDRCLESKLSFKRTWELMLVVDEICSCIVLNSENAETELQIFWKEKGNFVEVEIVDEDSPFNPLTPPAEEQDCPDLGAMGAYLIEKMVDKASYKRLNGNNRVIIIKNKCRRMTGKKRPHH